jgi:hypothetical protein
LHGQRTRKSSTRTGPPGWATIAEVLDEVDDDESDNFADFDDEEDASNITEEQWALVASFKTARL